MATKKSAPMLTHDDSDNDIAAPAPPKPKKAKQAVEQIYQKKTQLEHILLRPDTYIGSVEPVTEQMWVVEDDKMVFRQITYVPGLYKIFDEILVNAADNKQRDSGMDLVKINIEPENNTISIWNNGAGIPVQMHKDEKMYVPTMIFGHLLTSSNFNDEEKKVTGGRNGYGAKLCNVFSKQFTVETACRENKKSFKQTWKSNMSKPSDPKIQDYSGDDYTKITFIPDLTKFKMESLDNDIVALFRRRAYDIAGTTAGVRVFLNGKRLPIKGFKDYVDLILGDKLDEAGQPVKYHYEKVNDRWEIAVAPSDNNFQQVSFVNSIATTKGGRHIDYIADMVTKQLVEGINKKNKGGIQVKPFQIKNHLWVFCNCLIENPTFDSQTKENMTLQSKSFGSKCTPSETFWTKISKSGIIESVLQWAKFKQDNLLNKAAGGKKTNKLKGIPKLEDANDAGTRNSLDCTLILTEGDSAKTLAVAGLGVVGRDKYGVFPLRGKLLNVREASHKQIIENAEINALVKIIGLQYKKKYTTIDDMKTLRYGKLMIMTDQDHDGSHIKGLIINFIHHNWPSLLQMKFLEEFITPIVKVSKGNSVTPFFSLPELEEWKKSTPNWKTYKIKYYKGLGTSTSKEAKEYFENIERHRIKFKYGGSQDDDQITMAFSKKCVDLRKDWLTNWMDGCKRRKEFGLSEEVIYSSDVRAITYSEFVNKELVLFSNLDNERSIPCLVDGFKPGQRKVLFTCFKRNDKREVKVAQLGGSVAEHSAYHHGEQSLMSTIISMAQNYVGSNNINLLMPNGQFGTRLQGGKDCSAPRYIHTQLSTLARLIFDQRDDPLLNSLFDDNKKIEPEYYVPIIPMVLVNGADGIGTGWMTKVPNYNPREIVENIRRLIRGDEPQHMKPWYKNFRGDIIEVNPMKFCVSGEVGIINDTTLEITELPVGTWTQNYKEGVLEPMTLGTEKIPSLLNNYKEYNTDTTVRFILELKPGTMSKFEEQGYHKVLKLQNVINLTSMVLFDQNGCLRKYESELQILKEFFVLRLDMYGKRREYLVGLLSAESSKLTNQARFVVEKCDGTLVVENKKKKLMIDELIKRKYDSDPLKEWKQRQKSLREQEEDEDNNDDSTENQEEAVVEGRDYDYLLGMPIYSLTLERKEDLLKKRDEKQRELELIKRKTPADLYNDDLDAFMDELAKVEKIEEEESKTAKNSVASGSSKHGKKGSKDTKPKLTGLNRKKYEEQTCPSPIAERVRPKIDDLLAKMEVEAKRKDKKANGVGVKRETKKDKKNDVEKDEFDLMADENDSFFDRLNSSTDSINGATEKKPKATSSGDKKPAKPKSTAAPKSRQQKAGAGPASKTTKTKETNLKQTKLSFKPKTDDEDKPKSKTRAKSTKTTSKKQSPKKKGKKEFDFLSSSEDESQSDDIFSETDEEDEDDYKSKNKKKSYSSSGSEDEVIQVKSKSRGQDERKEKEKPKEVVQILDDSASDSDVPMVVKKNANGAAASKKRRVMSSDSDDSI